jgi:alpha-1,3-rhamnosyl/mannosyltransferase
MRIIVDASCLIPPLTGVGHYARNIIERLPQALPQAQIRYFTGFGWNKSLRPPPDFSRSRLRDLPGARWAWRALRAGLWRFGLPAAWHGRAVCFAPNFRPAYPFAPSVPVIHDISFVRLPETHPPGRLAWLAGLGEELERAAAIIAVSPFTAREIASHYGIAPARIKVAPPGLRTHLLEAGPVSRQALAELGLAEQSYFLCVGTLEPRKNLGTLVSAYSRLPPALRERVPLVLAGARGWGEWGQDRGWRDLIARGQLRLLSYVAEGALPGLYGGALAHCTPSLYEGFGMPVAEALCRGTPVLVSDAGALPETAGPGGLVVACRDVEAWTAALARIAEDYELRRTLSQAGRRHVMRHGWDDSAAIIAAALAEA